MNPPPFKDLGMRNLKIYLVKSSWVCVLTGRCRECECILLFPRGRREEVCQIYDRSFRSFTQHGFPPFKPTHSWGLMSKSTYFCMERTGQDSLLSLSAPSLQLLYRDAVEWAEELSLPPKSWSANSVEQVWGHDLDSDVPKALTNPFCAISHIFPLTL